MPLNQASFLRFQSFMDGFAAATLLGVRAQENGSFIESICLSASLIDAQLRIGLILKHQLDTGTADILDELLWQSNDKLIVTERSIFKQSLNAGIISENTCQLLNNLYHDRNRVVHRYIISEITTAEVVAISARYADAVHLISDAVRELEDKQIVRGVGMTAAGASLPELDRRNLRQDIERDADRKHGNQDLATKLRPNRAR